VYLACVKLDFQHPAPHVLDNFCATIHAVYAVPDVLAVLLQFPM
jgi:hypothetical protein